MRGLLDRGVCWGRALAVLVVLLGGRTAWSQVPSATFPGPSTKGEVCLAFAGDLMHHCVQGSGAKDYPGGPIEGYAAYFAHVKSVLDAAHVAIGNLETPLDKAERDCFPRFRAHPDYGFGLRKGGFDVVSLANNHATDYGSAGLAATLKWVKEAGLVPSGTTQQAPYVRLDIGAVKVGLVVYTMLNNGSCRGDPCPLITAKRDAVDQRLLEAVLKARSENDVVVVYIHWLTEYQVRTRKVDRELAQQLLGLGVHAVVGSHTHVLGTASWAFVDTSTPATTAAQAQPLTTLGSQRPAGAKAMRKAYVRYSLGNFVSGMKQFPVRMAGLETICFSPVKGGGYEVGKVDFIPTYVRRDTFRVRSRTYQVLPLKRAAAQCRTGKGEFPKFSGTECKEILEYDAYYDSIPDFAPTPPN